MQLKFQEQPCREDSEDLCGNLKLEKRKSPQLLFKYDPNCAKKQVPHNNIRIKASKYNLR